MAVVIAPQPLDAELVATPIALGADNDAVVRVPQFALDQQGMVGAVEVICEITWDGLTWRELGRDTFTPESVARDGSVARVRYDLTVWGDDDLPRSPALCRYRIRPVVGRPRIGATIDERRNPNAPPAPPRHHSIALVQSAKKVTTGSGTTLAYGSNTAANNLLCVTHAVYDGGGVTINTPTDSHSTSYAAIAAQQGGAGVGFIRSYYGVPGSSGANTVTFSGTAGSDLTVVVAEFSGAATTSPLDNNSTGSGTGTTPSSGAQTPSEDNCMIYGAAMHTGADTSWTQGGTLVQENEGGSANMPVAVQYIVQTTATSQAATWTLGASRDWYAHHGIFKAAAGGVSVTPGTASLTLTAFAPTVATPTLATPGTAALTLTAFAPTVTVTTLVTPGTASLTLTPFAPTVSNPTLATPGTASLTLTAFEPTVIAGSSGTFTPGTASLTLTAFAPTVTVTANVSVTPGTASLALTAFAPTVTATAYQSVTPGTASLSLTAFAPTVSVSSASTLVPGSASLTLTAFAPTVTATAHQSVTPGTASLVLTLFAPTVSTPVVVTPGVAALILTRFTPIVTATAGATLIPGTASLVLTAYAPTLTATGQVLTPLRGVVTIGPYLQASVDITAYLEGEATLHEYLEGTVEVGV